MPTRQGKASVIITGSHTESCCFYNNTECTTNFMQISPLAIMTYPVVVHPWTIHVWYCEPIALEDVVAFLPRFALHAVLCRRAQDEVGAAPNAGLIAVVQPVAKCPLQLRDSIATAVKSHRCSDVDVASPIRVG